MRRSRQNFFSHAKNRIAMIKVMDRLIREIAFHFRRIILVQRDVEWIFLNKLTKTTEERCTIIPRIASNIATGFPDIFGKRCQKKCCTIFEVAIKKLIRPHAQSEKSFSTMLRQLLCKRIQRFNRSPGDFRNRFRIEVSVNIFCEKIKDWSYKNILSISECHLISPPERRCDPLVSITRAIIVTRKHNRFFRSLIPHHSITPCFAVFIGNKRFLLKRRKWRFFSFFECRCIIIERTIRVFLPHLGCLEHFKGIHTNKTWKIRMFAKIFRVVRLLLEKKMTESKRKRGGRPRTNDNDHIGF